MCDLECSGGILQAARPLTNILMCDLRSQTSRWGHSSLKGYNVSNSNSKSSTVLCKVIDVCNGKGEDWYAACVPNDEKETERSGLVLGTSITFNRRAWRGQRHPERGQIVTLSEIAYFSAGLRAFDAVPHMATVQTERVSS